MQIKEVKPANFLFFRVETKVNNLANFLVTGQELYREAIRQNLSINGPVHWHYFGFNGDEAKAFTLEVALPVGELLNDYDGKFHFKRTESFKCVSMIHEGSWLEIPQSYTRLMQYVSRKHFEPAAVNREIYINSDLQNPEANITEIQMGIR